MKYIKTFNENKPAGAPEFHDSEAPDANGKFKNLSIKDLAAWLIKTRNKNVKKISASLTQQIVFNRNDDPEYAEKMEKTRQEVYKQLGRKDLMDNKQIDKDMKYIKSLNELNAVFDAIDGNDSVIEAKAKPGPDAYETGLDDDEVEDKKDQMKKQAKMDDDNPKAYKEMPGDEEARESGKVKTSKHVKSYHELYGDDETNEALITSDDKEYLNQITSFLKKYKDKRGLDNDKKFTAEVIKVLKQRVSDRGGLVKKRFQKILKSIEKDFKSGNYLKLNESTILEKSKVLKLKEWGIDNHVELKQLMDYLQDEDINWNQRGQSLKFDSVEDVDKAKKWLGESILFEGVMGDLHQMAGEVKSEDEFVKKFFKEYGAKIKKSSDSVEWVKSLYQDTVEEKLTEAKRSKVYKAAKNGNYPAVIVVVQRGKVIHQEPVNTPEVAPATFNVMQNKYPDATIHLEDNTGQRLFTEAVNEDKEKKKQSTDRTPLEDDAMETGLKKKADETGVPIGIIRAVARRGLAAWKTGHRPGATQQQWAYARVNSFLTKQPGTWGGADGDLAKEVRDGGHDKKLKKD